MISVRDVWRQGKDHGRLRRRVIGVSRPGFAKATACRQVQRRVQFDFVAHRNLDAPAQIVVRRWLRRRLRRSRRLRHDICRKKCREHCDRKRLFHAAVLKMNCTSETRVLSCSRKRREDSSHSQSLRELNRASRAFCVKRFRSAMRPLIALMVCRHVSLRHDTPWLAGLRKARNLKNKCLAT